MSPPHHRSIPIRPAEPHSAGEPPVADAERRQVLKLMAASLALGSSGCVRRPDEPIYAYGQMPERSPGTPVVSYATSVVREGHAHGVLVITKNGRPVKVEGLPGHPSSLGATDVFAQASVLQLWDPDRSQAVTRRVAEGASGMNVSSWADFQAVWGDVQARVAAGRGERLRILSGPCTSPTLRAQMQALLARWPGARWHIHDPLLSTASQDEGTRLLFGRALQPLHHLSRARVVASFGADPFQGGPAAVRQAADWSRARQAQGASGATLFAVDTSPGLFSARADHRIALSPADTEALLGRMARQLLPDVTSADTPPPAAPPLEGLADFENRLLRALREAGGQGLLIAGPQLSGAAHALVHLLNWHLGHAGRTLDYIEPTAPLGEHMLAGLCEAMHAGEVDTLVMLGTNPAYDAPPALRFAAALKQVRCRIHHGLYEDETAALCDWHLPASHGFEQWSDARAFDGTASIIQPCIAPLYDTRSAHEVLAMLTEGARSGHEIVRATWKATWRTPAGRPFDDVWRGALRQGLVAGSASRPVTGTLTPRPLRGGGATTPLTDTEIAADAAAGATTLTACLVPSPTMRDGSWANNAWLQELPDTYTKITWGNALLIGPRTAARLGLRTGDVVELGLASPRRLPAQEPARHWPVWVQAGHAEGVVSLPTGYGRWRAGSVGDQVGVNAFALSDGQPSRQITVRATGARHDFALTQHERSQHGRDLARTTAPGQRAEPPTSDTRPSLYPPVDYPTQAWGMVIDLDACIGCNVCTIACQAENNIPSVGAEQVAKGREMHWIRVDTYVDEPTGATQFQPVPCMHCENAPCELVCPVGATMHDSEGLNVQVYNRCIGTRFCSNNCPYKVRRFNFLQYSDEHTESLKAMRNPDVTVRMRGVMEKCTYCVQRISAARREREVTGQPLRDGDVVTACQAACPTRAIHFGDLNDPGSDVSRLRAHERHYSLLGELNTRPRTTYLARTAPKGSEQP